MGGRRLTLHSSALGRPQSGYGPLYFGEVMISVMMDASIGCFQRMDAIYLHPLKVKELLKCFWRVTRRDTLRFETLRL